MQSFAKSVQAFLLGLMLIGSCFGADPKIVAPSKDGKIGPTMRLKVEGALTDPKFDCVPVNENWFVVKQLDNTVVILFDPQDEGTYWFILSDNAGGKTIQSVVKVQIGKPVPPKPDVPVPDVPVNKGIYTDRLTAPYLVSPNPSAKKELSDIYAAMAINVAQFATNKDANVALATRCSKEFTNGELQAVRDEAAKILQEQLKMLNGPVNKDLFIKVFNDLSKSVAGIP
jgi:hypothetical protein